MRLLSTTLCVCFASIGCSTNHDTVAVIEASAGDTAAPSSLTEGGKAAQGGSKSSMGGNAKVGGSGSLPKYASSGGKTSSLVTPSSGGSNANAGGTLSVLGTGGSAQAGAGAGAGAGTSVTDTCGNNFVACGCGCCTGAPTANRCYYPSLGESVATVTKADEAVRMNTNCDMAGCSIPVNYVCCSDAAPISGDTSIYGANFNFGGYDRIRLTKTMPNNKCAAILLVSPSQTVSGKYGFTLPTNWSIASMSLRNCEMSAEYDQSVGGIGTIAVDISSSSCQLSIHGTAFVAATSGEITPIRFDADKLPVSGC